MLLGSDEQFVLFLGIWRLAFDRLFDSVWRRRRERLCRCSRIDHAMDELDNETETLVCLHKCLLTCQRLGLKTSSDYNH
jgi:hypothetical protein